VFLKNENKEKERREEGRETITLIKSNSIGCHSCRTGVCVL
jgi:hypothetical protein